MTDRTRTDGRWGRLWLVLAAGLVAGAILLRMDASPHRGVAGDDEQRQRRPAVPAEASVRRSWHGVGIRIPATWERVASGSDFATWGSADRAHTVTVGRTDASIVPLVGVASAAIGASRRALPGLEQVGRSQLLRPGRADDAVLVHLRLAPPASIAGPGPRPLHIVQVWRRSNGSKSDLVATWTSRDGLWPAAPAEHVPEPGPDIR